MPTATDVVTFAIDLAVADLRNLRPWAWAQWRDRLATALGQDRAGRGTTVGLLIAAEHEGPKPKSFEPDAFRQVQRDLNALLQAVSAHGQLRPLKVVRVGPYWMGALPYRGKSVRWIRGSVRDTLLLVLLEALEQVPDKFVGRCPECDRLFPAPGKRRYCSRLCANRASMKQWRRTHGPDVVRTLSRQSCERRVAPARPRPYRPRRGS